MSTRTSKRIAAVTLALLAAAQLTGCGGGDSPADETPPPQNPGGGSGSGDGGTGGGSGGGGSGGGGGGGGVTPPPDPPPAPPPGELTSGVFVDAAVAGLSYTTSSDLTGVTDQEGRYDYRVGDTVTFSIGDLVLGTVPAQGVVTPVTVASALVANTSADAETVAVNLLVLLQSLDANGNPEDGITFTQEIRDAVDANAIDLTAAEGAFTSSLSTLVTSVSGSAGVALTPVTREDAVTHFVGQSPGALAGVYVRADENFEPITEKIVTLTMFRSGRYLLGGQHDLADCNLSENGTPVNAQVFSDDRGNGVEFGAYSWDPLTNEFSVSAVNVETDGYCGFNEPVVGATNDTNRLEITADGLVFRDADGGVSYRFVRMEREDTTIGGAWLQPTGLMKGRPFVFTLFPSAADGLSGRYLVVDAAPADPVHDTTPGIEEGCYSVDAQDNLTVQACANAIDTNDTAGVSGAANLQLFLDENDRLVIADNEEWTGFTRLPVERVTHEAMAGAWMMELSRDGGSIASEAQMFMLTVFEDGRFLFGTQHDDSTCSPVDYPTPGQEPDGNGLEYGTLSLTAVPGLVVPQTSVDTNGECGLFNATSPIQQRYFIAPNAAGDALVLWANDEEDEAGFVLKRVPSVPDELTGAWLWTEEGAGADEFAVVAYLPEGVMFETSLFADFHGIRRESFTYEGTTMTSRIAGYQFCEDTQNDPSECDVGDPDFELVETYIVEGDTMPGDEGSVITRIPAP